MGSVEICLRSVETHEDLRRHDACRRWKVDRQVLSDSLVRRMQCVCSSAPLLWPPKMILGTDIIRYCKQGSVDISFRVSHCPFLLQPVTNFPLDHRSEKFLKKKLIYYHTECRSNSRRGGEPESLWMMHRIDTVPVLWRFLLFFLRGVLSRCEQRQLLPQPCIWFRIWNAFRRKWLLTEEFDLFRRLACGFSK
jgi:hypothetical protein